MPLHTQWFQDWFNSPYYHKLYFEHNEQEAKNFINELMAHLRPKAGSYMLDVACGRGRHAKYLSEKGFDVTGFDLAPTSIAYAKEYENDHLHFYEHDMRLPFWINYFDYAFNFFTSFGYFRTERENYNVIRTIATALKRNGICMIDYLNSTYVESHLVPIEVKRIGHVTYHIKRWCDETHFYKNIIIEDTSLPIPLEFTEKVAKFKFGDFNDMFSWAKMHVQDIFGDYKLSMYDKKESPRLIMIAKRI
jgi:SAM-dependent methyltransferase